MTGSTISLSSLRVKFRRIRSVARRGGPTGSTGLEGEAEEPEPFALLFLLFLASQLSIAAWSKTVPDGVQTAVLPSGTG